MACVRDIFKLSGPRHLTTIDWSDPDQRRSIAASLVQGVYVQERDRQEGRLGPDAHAPLWWTSFKFKLLYPLIDGVDGSVFGAVYKWSKKLAAAPSRPPGAPKIVVAFRGTIAKPDSLLRDVQLDLKIITNELHTTCRFRAAVDAVEGEVHRHGGDNVWIAGHSLGAAVAMLAGRKMAEEEGRFLEAHLFNPPFVSPPVERIKNEKIKRGFHFARSLLTAGLLMTIQDKCALIESQKAFSVLRSWVPCLYVNPRDDLCSGYVGHFENQRAMQRMGAGAIATLAAQHSISDMVLSAFGKESKAGDLIPCARVIVSLNPAPDFKRAHGIHQWWSPNMRIQCTEYRLPQEPASVFMFAETAKSSILTR